jgi:hypothetical protein
MLLLAADVPLYALLTWYLDKVGRVSFQYQYDNKYRKPAANTYD